MMLMGFSTGTPVDISICHLQVSQSVDTQSGARALICAKSGAPIVPVYISPKSYRGAFRLYIMVGDVIRPDEISERCDRRKLTDVVTYEMQNALEELQFSMQQKLKNKGRER